MKKRYLIGLLSLLLTGCGGNSTSTSSSHNSSSTKSEEKNPSSSINELETVDIIVLAGQSNMEGHSWSSKLYENTPTSIHNYYANGFDNTMIMYHCNEGKNQSEEFVKVKTGQGYGTGSFGPEVGIAEEWHNREKERPLYIIKYALGATDLYTNWNVNNSNSLYYLMVDYIYDQLVYFEQQNLKPVIKGFFWMQGEADSCTSQATSAYYNNLSNLVTSFREEFEDYYSDPEKGIAFVDAGISDCETWVNHENINLIKKSFAESNPEKNYYFDTMENGLEYDKDNTDYYHFDATSEIKLGKLFINQLLDNGWL